MTHTKANEGDVSPYTKEISLSMCLPKETILKEIRLNDGDFIHYAKGISHSVCLLKETILKEIRLNDGDNKNTFCHCLED